MTLLKHYDPWSVLDGMHREMNRALAGRYQGGSYGNTGDDSNVDTADWAPAVDIQETGDAFVLHADIPGVKPEDIDITMEKGVLTIKGERGQIAEERRKDYKRVERTRGAFFRRFSLPDTADAEGVFAKGEHGVLVITIPKRPEEQPRRIEVSVH